MTDVGPEEPKQCRYWTCEEERREYNPPEVDGFASKFCSDEHELKFEHIKADADDARRQDRNRTHHDNVPRQGKTL